MIDLHELGYWLAALGLLAGVLLLTHPSWLRRILGHRLDRLGAWALEQVRPVAELDPLAEELYRIRRRERLYADLARLQRLLANDMAMSATRQLGNRIAYDWVVGELERTRSWARLVVPDLAPDRWSMRAVAGSSAGAPITHDPQRGSTVEVLDIGWRS
jgi:hypothetical protein